MKEKLTKLTEMLLDTGKSNNLINFRDNKSNTLEVVFPEFNLLFRKVENNACLEVFDPQLDVDEFEEKVSEAGFKEKFKDKAKYTEKFSKMIKKSTGILVYNKDVTPLKAMRNLDKKAKTAIEETGVNVAYMALGFINWYEEQAPEVTYAAPILLAPIGISKKSSVDPYRISVTGDDMILNPTFAYKLQSEYKITLPDYDGEGIEEYLDRIGKIVSPLKWQVSSVCKLGLFSFLKINMYMDLKDNADEVLKNESVRSILGEGRTTPLSQQLSSAQYNVVDADSSQLRAIEMAKSGESFVLQGPPGTGKSQTITNIIAECMGDGKKVLFVSEKLAALDVVYSKLKQAGLEDFCLQLHSHKANKRDFIQELCRTMRLSKVGVSSRASEEEDRLNKSHTALDYYVEVLHRKAEVIDKSIFELIEEVCAGEEGTVIDYFFDEVESKGEDFVKTAVESLEGYAEYTQSIGYDYKANAWYGYCDPDDTHRQKYEVKTSLQSLLPKLEKCNSYAQKLAQDYDIEGVVTLKQLSDYAKLLRLLGEGRYIGGKLLDKRNLTVVLSKSAKLSPLAQEIKIIKESVLKDYGEDIFNLDAQTTASVLNKCSSLGARLFSKPYNTLMGKIKSASKSGKAKYRDAVVLSNLLISYWEKMQEFEVLGEGVKDKFPKSYQGAKSDWAVIDGELATLKDLLGGISDLGSLAKRLDGEDAEYDKESFSYLAGELLSLLDSIDGEVVVKAYDKDTLDIYAMPVADLQAKMGKCLDNIDTLDGWTKFLGVFATLRDNGLTGFIDEAVKQGVAPKDMARTFKKCFYRQWIDVLTGKDEFLKNLTRVKHDNIVNIFCDKDVRGFEISKAKIRSAMSSLRPDLSIVVPGSAVANLLNEGSKKRKLKPIRTLLSQIRELAQNLKPCFLMSPLSVSTFLTSDVKFDVVVFDEASQIFPQDAIGAIYRGKQLIVVGDSKQMPPSNFFTSVVASDEDEEDYDDVKDYESVLDLCATVMPQLRLKWHYRSRYESLIQFSNAHFYEGDLVTFPSAKTDKDGIGVDFKFVEGGIFDHKSRTNRAEAEYIVDLVFKNIEEYPDRSLGVVAFSISQQDLIERLLAKRRRENSSYEEYFSIDKAEPFFVKNLETVQGDERDTIIFSVAYGRDKDGKISQNFGPINKSGGERRLNVAFTRAKLNVQLVSSVHAYDINLKNSNSLGARLLRDYLDFAETGKLELPFAVEQADGQVFDFEGQVADFLKANGYEVDVKIGMSAGSVDIGVKDGEDYVLAVECDGRAYKSAKNTRDRDRLRTSVLERMGWSYHRVWAIDWIKNNKDEKDRLLKAVSEAMKCPADYTLDKDTHRQDDGRGEERGDDSRQEDGRNGEDNGYEGFEEEQVVEDFAFPEYKCVDFADAKRESKGDYLKYLRLVLQVEAPLSEEFFLKRTLKDFDREKLTEAVWDRFNRLTSRCKSEGIVRKDGFMYLLNRPAVLRAPNDDFVREIKYIAPEELAEGIYKVICKNITVDRMGLYRMLAKTLGYAKLSESMIKKFDEAVELLKGKIDVEGEELSTLG